jgi:hypothetical protein
LDDEEAMAAVGDRAPRDVAMEVRIDQGLRAREEPSTTSGWANGRQTRLGSNEGSPWTGGRKIRGPVSVGRAKRIQAVSDDVMKQAFRRGAAMGMEAGDGAGDDGNGDAEEERRDRKGRRSE